MEERQDLISRQVAIDALRDAENHAFNSFYKGLAKAHKIIADLPSVQPDHVADISKKVDMDDLISRRAVIDALHTWFRDGFDEDKWWNSTHVLAAIEGLPSAQQGYKWETCFECPLSHGCQKIKGCTNGQAIEYASQMPNDCPLSAQPEPHWIPCSERLPKKTGYYLTTNEYKVVHEDYYWGSGCFEKAKKYQCEVVAWMPMPIPPYCGGWG